MQSDISIVLPLNQIDELFAAPAANPFSPYEVDILGQAGMDCVQKRVTRRWPRRPHAVHVTLQLPADQITPGLTERTQDAVQRYCAERIDDNRVQRGLTMQRALRQLLGASVGILAALVFIAVLLLNPFGLLPDFLRGVLIVLALYACSVISFDAVWSVAFDWVPFVQDSAVYRVMRGMDIVVERQTEERDN